MSTAAVPFYDPEGFLSGSDAVTISEPVPPSGIADSGFIAPPTPSLNSNGVDPESLPTVGTPDQQNTGMLQLLQTAIATGGALGQIALGVTPQKVIPGQGSQNPARPGVFSTAQGASQIQGFLIIIALVLGAVLLFRMFGKK